MATATATALETATVLFDPYFLQEIGKGEKGEVVAATIRTSRFLVLTQDSSAPVGKAVIVSQSGDLTVYGESVRIAGNVTLPGRKVKIFCRRLEFFPGNDGKSSLSVAGAAGVNTPSLAAPARPGEHGVESSPAGKTGDAGENGANGPDGAPGGSIEIYCDLLAIAAQVELTAEGGRGADGNPGRPGAAGGRGWDGYALAAAPNSGGGRGGCGGNGGDGGNGGLGGRITLYFMNLERQNENCNLTVSALGGRGGNGGNPGPGGNGGDGGNFGDTLGNQLLIDDFYKQGGGLSLMLGAPGGDGGVCGLPGYAGNGGGAGSVTLGLPLGLKPGSDAKQFSTFDWRELYMLPSPSNLEKLLGSSTPALALAFPNSPHPGQGSDGNAFAKDKEYAESGSVVVVAGFDPGGYGKLRNLMDLRAERPADANQRRKTVKPPRAALGAPDSPRTIDHRQIGYKDLANQMDANAFEMVFDQVRLRFLMTPLDADANDIAALVLTVQWLMMVADAAGNPAMFASAAATLQNLRLGYNIFGKNMQFAALGSLESYKSDLETMLGLFKPIEEEYQVFSQGLKEANEQRQYLQNLDRAQASLSSNLSEMKEENGQRLRATLAEVDTLDATRLRLATALSDEISALDGKIQDACGLTAQDFASLFGQLAFTNTENKPLGAAMLGSQAADMIIKAIDNVSSDTGAPLNKKFVIRRMQSLEKDVKSVAALKKTRDGFLQADPQAEYRLLSTRDQLTSIVSNFYDQFPVARSIADTFDEYMAAVSTRNQAVEEYNQALADFAYIQSEIEKLKQRRTETQALLQSSAQPGLPAIAKFSNALRRYARERCIEQIYLACRVYTMQSLDLYDVFGNVLGQLSSGDGELNATALNTALIDLISRSLADYQKKRTSRASFQPIGNHCSVQLTPKKNPLLFQLLRAGKPGTFQLLAPGPLTTIERSPFAGMADVRLTHIRCSAQGMKTSDGIQCMELGHSGVETFFTEDGKAVQLNHSPMTHASRYDAKNNLYQDDGKLDQAHDLIGSFCQWTLSIPKEENGSDLDLSQLESIRVEFTGSYRPFLPGSAG